MKIKSIEIIERQLHISSVIKYLQKYQHNRNKNISKISPYIKNELKKDIKMILAISHSAKHPLWGMSSPKFLSSPQL